MKTVHISDGLWKALKMRSVELGVPLREVVEEAGASWLALPRIPAYGAAGFELRDEVSRQFVAETPSAQELAKKTGLKLARELTVELED